MQNSIFSIVFILIAAAVGYAVGILARRKQDYDEAQAAPVAPAPVAIIAEQTAPTPAPVASPDDGHTALRVSIDKHLKWWLEIDGNRLEGTPDSLTPEQRQRLVTILVQIRPWLENKPGAPASSVSPAPAVPSISAESRPVMAPVHPTPAAPASDALSTAPPPRLSLGRGFRSVLETEIQGKKIDTPPIVSIVGLIDNILQKNIANTPLAARNIKLEESATGEVLVLIGITRQPLEAVPDTQVKAAIQQAIAEFNQSK